MDCFRSVGKEGKGEKIRQVGNGEGFVMVAEVMGKIYMRTDTQYEKFYLRRMYICTILTKKLGT